jgi:hypothetical protein
MSIPEVLLNQLKCCLNNDGHIVNEAIVLKCAGIACKNCFEDLKAENLILNCYKCNRKHDKKVLLVAPRCELAETLIRTFIGDFFNYIENNMKLTSETIKSKIIIL